MTQEIKVIIEEAIPLDMNCAIVRSDQLKRRAKLRLDIEELIREEIKKLNTNT